MTKNEYVDTLYATVPGVRMGSHPIQVDVAIIGAGSAGLTARRGALKQGKSVLLIEGGPYGTTCARVGCMPSKLLIAAADAAHATRHSAEFGLRTTLEIDGRAVLERVRSERDRFVGGVLHSVEKMPAEQKLRGHARFVANTVLDVDGQRVEAGAVVIATGASTWLPPQIADVGDRLITSETIFDLEDLPRSVVVFGSGVIGLELGQALHRLGVHTVLLDPMQGLNFLSDPVVRESAIEVFSRELSIYLNAKIHSVTNEDAGVRVKWTSEDGKHSEEVFEKVLGAAGRRPNLEGLDLDRTTIAFDSKKLPVFDPRTMQVGDLPIFIAGDVNHDRPLLHEAADEGYIAGANAANYPNVRAMPRRTELVIVFTDPQIAVVGTPFSRLEENNWSAGKLDFAGQGRARIMARNAGMMRIYGTPRCGFIVGAEMIAPFAEHMAHLLAWTVQARMTVTQAIEMPYYHPTVEEGLRTALRDLASELKVNELPCEGDNLRDGPGT